MNFVVVIFVPPSPCPELTDKVPTKFLFCFDGSPKANFVFPPIFAPDLFCHFKPQHSTQYTVLVTSQGGNVCQSCSETCSLIYQRCIEPAVVEMDEIRTLLIREYFCYDYDLSTY
eukprot:GFUD01056488.1.p1 GENE.GFUD01056488.1~~GFUD01056488.1.p1  ORF type:complete len:115 (+),score=0.67 GFUD01056488.1:170-514(+)